MRTGTMAGGTDIAVEICQTVMPYYLPPDTVSDPVVVEVEA